jgi:hypothetical protein
VTPQHDPHVDPVALRILDQHGWVAGIRMHPRLGAYVQTTFRSDRSTITRMRQTWVLGDLGPSGSQPIYLFCKKGDHFLPVTLGDMLKRLTNFRAGSAPTTWKIQWRGAYA